MTCSLLPTVSRFVRCPADASCRSALDVTVQPAALESGQPALPPRSRGRRRAGRARPGAQPRAVTATLRLPDLPMVPSVRSRSGRSSSRLRRIVVSSQSASPRVVDNDAFGKGFDEAREAVVLGGGPVLRPLVVEDAAHQVSLAPVGVAVHGPAHGLVEVAAVPLVGSLGEAVDDGEQGASGAFHGASLFGEGICRKVDPARKASPCA
jgi:hypothetical protein